MVREQMRTQKSVWIFQNLDQMKRERERKGLSVGERDKDVSALDDGEANKWKTMRYSVQYGGTFDCTSAVVRERANAANFQHFHYSTNVRMCMCVCCVLHTFKHKQASERQIEGE